MMRQAASDTPIAAKPNAGMPVMSDTGEAIYTMSPDVFAHHMQALQHDGASLLGGCCGTTPAFIAALQALR